MVAQDHGAPDWWSCFLPSEWAQTWILYPLLAHSRCSGPACLSCRDEPWTLLGNGSPDERTRPQALYSKLLLLFLLATCLSLWAKANFNQSLSTSWGWSSFTKIFLKVCASPFLVHSKPGVPWRLVGERVWANLSIWDASPSASPWSIISHHQDDVIMRVWGTREGPLLSYVPLHHLWALYSHLLLRLQSNRCSVILTSLWRW